VSKDRLFAAVSPTAFARFHNQKIIIAIENIVDASQSRPALPVENLAQIFQDYFAFRNKGIRNIPYVSLAIMHSGGIREVLRKLFSLRK
jgi:hypothetical protein